MEAAVNIKKYGVWGLTLTLSVIIITGSTQNTDNVKTIDESDTGSPVSAVEDETQAPTYDLVGEVIEIDGRDVHILTGDIVDIYTVNNTDDIHLGERVQIISHDGVQTVKPFIVENFDVKHTSMGQTIEKISGTIKNVYDDSFMLATEHEEITFEYHGDMSQIQKNMTADIEFIRQYGQMENHLVVNAYNMENILELTVDSLSRSDQGMLIAKCTDAQGMASYVNILPGTNDNFNISQLEVNDKIEVIPDVIMESYPVQINPKRVQIIK